jgi:hypothetical protein
MKLPLAQLFARLILRTVKGMSLCSYQGPSARCGSSLYGAQRHALEASPIHNNNATQARKIQSER